MPIQHAIWTVGNQPEHRLPTHSPEVAPHRRAIEEILYELGSAQPEPVG